MPSLPSIAVTGDIINAAWGNGVRNYLNATAPAVVTTAGDLVYATAAGVITRLGIGTARQQLHVNGGATAPEWFTPPSVRAYEATSGQTIATGTETAITFNTDRYDTSAMHDTSSNTSRLTAPIAGVYAISACIAFTDLLAGKKLTIQLRVNGTTSIARKELFNTGASPIGAYQDISTLYKLAANDYVEVTVTHDCGVNESTLRSPNAAPEFGMTWIGVG